MVLLVLLFRVQCYILDILRAVARNGRKSIFSYIIRTFSFIILHLSDFVNRMQFIHNIHGYPKV